MKTCNLKYTLVFFLVFWFTSKDVYADDGWTQLNLGISNTFNNVFFINPLTGWIAGQGPILGTTNGGNNWSIEYYGTNADFRSLYFSNNQTGYAAGVLNGVGLIVKTTNAGQNWVQQVTGVGYFILSIYFRNNSDTGWAVGGGGVILKTVDGGANWVLKNSGTTLSLTCISHPYPNRGWIGKSGSFILYSSDRGESWTQQQIGLSDNWLSQSQICCNGVGYLMGTSNVMKTTNFGSNWFVLPGVTSFIRNSVYFINENTGWVVGHYLSTGGAAINFTTNGGSNWTSQLTTVYQEDLFSVYFANDLTGYAVGYGGLVLKTTNGGVITGFNKNTTDIPNKFKLYQNYPNPFNPVTAIRFELPRTSAVKLVVYDLLGRETEVLVNGTLKAGSFSLNWDASNFTSGVYLYRITAGNFAETRKMVLVK
jgi:photosystem II stability/assembly factor-like uncharacterized protein